MANSIAYTKNYTSILDEVYKRAACSTCLNSPRRMARAGRNAKEIMVPKIEVTGLGDYTRNVGYKTESITYKLETKTFNYDRDRRNLPNSRDGSRMTSAPSLQLKRKSAPSSRMISFLALSFGVCHECCTAINRQFAHLCQPTNGHTCLPAPLLLGRGTVPAALG
ncbi:hypothetical protein [Collinsella intestinalis]|uniref:hypothetical protein n=1 Tax=Collinsella intestinalis TaxID=147207 RepID=UPI001EF46B9B|nr:hypothetical protein [Collinsella intestinalis]